jgi:energy-coupling factor transporter ATP-binding protein EcfA2
MRTTYLNPSKPMYYIILLSLTTILLGSCSRAHQLGMDDPQAILNTRLNDPNAVLTPNQSIVLLNHCAGLGEQNAAHATNKVTCLFLGNTGTGKSTTLNALLGCAMREEGNGRRRKRIVVDADSSIAEIMHIGHHGRQSQTFMPQIVQDPNNPNNAYCDCPGFLDNRGAEINIANAINIRKILQQASGVKAVFLTSYHGLFEDRGSSIRAMETTCREMFGGADNLRRHQNAVLLGITKAPRYDEDGQSLSVESVQLELRDSGSSIAQILAERVFLFDPLDRGSNNPDFWSLARCRTEIAQLQSIPQSVATALFRVPLADSDHRHLLTTVRGLRSKIINAITQGEVATLRQHWQLLLRLGVIEHPEVTQLIEGDVLPAINAAILERAGAIKDATGAYEFDSAQGQLNQLMSITNSLPGAPLACDIYGLQRHIEACIAKQGDDKAFKEQFAKMQADLVESHRQLEEARKNGGFRFGIGALVGAAIGFAVGGPAGAIAGALKGMEHDMIRNLRK